MERQYFIPLQIKSSLIGTYLFTPQHLESIWLSRASSMSTWLLLQSKFVDLMYDDTVVKTASITTLRHWLLLLLTFCALLWCLVLMDWLGPSASNGLMRARYAFEALISCFLLFLLIIVLLHAVLLVCKQLI